MSAESSLRTKKKPPDESGGFFILVIRNQIFLIFSSILKMDLLEPMNKRL